MSQALEIEAEIIEEQDKIYEEQFVNDFKEVLIFLNESHTKDLEKNSLSLENNHEASTENDQHVDPKPEKHESLKKLYRSLARKTHPDVDDSLPIEEFRSIQKAYEDDDIFSLFTYAVKYDITLDFSNADLDYMNRSISRRREKFLKQKETVRWVWSESKAKNEKLRTEIMISMGVNLDDYEKWKEIQKLNQTLDPKDTEISVDTVN